MCFKTCALCFCFRVSVKDASQKISLAVGMRTQLSHIRIYTLHGAPWSKLSIKDKVCHVTAELRLSYLTKSSSESGCVIFLVVRSADKFKLRVVFETLLVLCIEIRKLSESHIFLTKDLYSSFSVQGEQISPESACRRCQPKD